MSAWSCGVTAAARKIEGDQQQEDAEDAPEHVRHFDHGQRQRRAKPREALRKLRGGAGEEQQRAGQEGRSGEEPRCDGLEPALDGRSRAPEVGATPVDLVGGERDDRQRQRQQVVDDAIGDDRGEHLVAREIRAEQEHHRRLEDAEASGHVTHEPDDDSQQVGAEEERKAQVG
jgi:hypothetical protein